MTNRYRALLIGNSRYLSDEDNLPSLEGPVNDLTFLRAALQDPLVGLFTEDDVTVRAEGSSHDLIGALDDFFTTADRNDVLLLYYSGHGRLDHTNTLYLCTADTRTDRLRATAVSSSRLNEMIDASVATRTVIVLDCCHSGAFKGDALAGPLAAHGRYVLASCRARELSSDAQHANRPSLFTANLVAGLRGAASNRANPGYLVLEELHAYVRDQLAGMGRHRPQLVSRGDGGLAIAKRPAGVSPPRPLPPAPLPVELAASTKDFNRLPGAPDVEVPRIGDKPLNRRRPSLAWLAGGAAFLVLLLGVLGQSLMKARGDPDIPPTVGPSTPSPGVSPSHSTLSVEQLNGALLALSDLPAGFTGGTTKVSSEPGSCGDPTATVLADFGRKAGPVRVSYSRSANELDKERVVAVQEDLASYATDQDAVAAMARFRSWITQCQSPTPGLLGGSVRVTGLSIDSHGDQTLAATGWSLYRMLTTPFSQLSQHAILVVVRVDRTVCVLRVASQASAVVNRVYSTPPAIADVNGYATMAVTKLTSGT